MQAHEILAIDIVTRINDKSNPSLSLIVGDFNATPNTPLIKVAHSVWHDAYDDYLGIDFIFFILRTSFHLVNDIRISKFQPFSQQIKQ